MLSKSTMRLEEVGRPIDGGMERSRMPARTSSHSHSAQSPVLPVGTKECARRLEKEKSSAESEDEFVGREAGRGKCTVMM